MTILPFLRHEWASTLVVYNYPYFKTTYNQTQIREKDINTIRHACGYYNLLCLSENTISFEVAYYTKWTELIQGFNTLAIWALLYNSFTYEWCKNYKLMVPSRSDPNNLNSWQAYMHLESLNQLKLTLAFTLTYNS